MYNVTLPEEGIVITRRHFYMCDNDPCAAIILHQLEVDAHDEQLIADMEGRAERPWLYTCEKLAEKQYNIFSFAVIREAMYLLEEKQYISVQWLDNDEKERHLEQCVFTVVLHRRQISLAENMYRAMHLVETGKLYSNVVETPQPEQGQKWSLKPEQKHQREAAKVRYHLARASELELPATLTLEQWLGTLEHFQWKCAFCQGPYILLEHFIPLALGMEGTVQSNCVPACRSCNSKKGSDHPATIATKYEMADAIQKVQAYLLEAEQNTGEVEVSDGN
jgi:5-methylcytosine-specific restriction endonuclease McrA